MDGIGVPGGWGVQDEAVWGWQAGGQGAAGGVQPGGCIPPPPTLAILLLLSAVRKDMLLIDLILDHEVLLLTLEILPGGRTWD